MNVFEKYHLGKSSSIQLVRSYRSILVVVLLLPSTAMANDSTSFASYILTFAPGEVTKEVSSPSRSPRFSRQAKEDAAAFIASDGAIRGPFLESAIHKFRITESSRLNDRDIASFIFGGS
ncbi:DUF2388 domain-containing protein [Pseudomonas sp. C1C7]|uniref:DUF2388 domain-containing protein n=1 Tax=Pseudomonas sp. C1C7 TaxID=2735272 RepID=UPI001586D841|nr:DUF2388 domain-containing protein [Pseudomonas sp. C1C7]NUT78863.1 DUF2388 domain-containing protein [Pseudomonas sp. C1C7]